MLVLRLVLLSIKLSFESAIVVLWKRLLILLEFILLLSESNLDSLSRI